MKTKDKDLIHFSIEPGAVDPASVDLVLELYDSLTWRKAFQWMSSQGAATVTVWRDHRADACAVPLQKLPGTRLRFLKDKGPGEPFVLLEPCFELDGLESLPGGSRVTFRWIRDK